MDDDKILQTKLNAISAKILHLKASRRFQNYRNIFIILTVLVPIAFIGAQYVAKGTSYQDIFDIISAVLSVTLIIFALTSSLILKVEDRLVIHKMGLKFNMDIINECDKIHKANEAERDWFYRYVTEIDRQDHDIFSSVSEEEKRKTYRNALKEVEPGNYSITCPLCNQSPWKYQPGDCEMCGNKTKENDNS